MIWLLSHHLPTPFPRQYKLDQRHTGRLRKRDNLLKRRGGGWWESSQIIRRREMMVLCKSLNTLCVYKFWLWRVDNAPICIWYCILKKSIPYAKPHVWITCTVFRYTVTIHHTMFHNSFFAYFTYLEYLNKQPISTLSFNWFFISLLPFSNLFSSV
jgi:hypothetical protein